MRDGRVSFLGGNGHSAARLEAARRALPPRVELVDTPYPGFEGRPRAAGLEEFLDAVASHLRTASPGLVYATGIGGLLALCLRARGELAGVPILLQGAVLWGLERRWMPRVMRLGPARGALLRLFATRAFQRRFARMHFTRPPAPDTLAAFFDGYARCTAAPDLFAWMTPALLRHLERELAARPAALGRIRVWWGDRDRVVTPRELAWTRQALGPGADWPLRVVSGWGHYPMIDEPEAWARATSDAVAEARAV
jgi:pimeloyl-ACP methyl ester carboxylesterase